MKEASFLIAPLIFFASINSSEVDYYSNSNYFNSEYRPRCAIREYGNRLPYEDEYKRICTDRSGCEWELTDPNHEFYKYSCCPTDSAERNAVMSGGLLYPECQ